ncbi:hypothetical protein BBJ28_00012370 [Nothophytophthora sp. Chile5]|nr:hypothetical protein BBJ28_00012370 [Nothophytophthora sp. Chile5]
MEEESSVWGPSVNVVLDGDMFASEKEFEKFMDALVSDEVAVTRAESKATLSPPLREGEAGVQAKRVPPPVVVQSKPARRSRKHEIDHLRAVAAELEKQLRMLSRSPSLDKPGATQFWKRVSNRLLEQRQQAVVENARLRRLVREQVSAVKTMQRSLAKTPALSVSGHLCMALVLHPEQKLTVLILPFNFRQIGDQAWKYLTDTNGHKNFQLVRLDVLLDRVHY